MEPSEKMIEAAADAYDASIQMQPREHTQALYYALTAALAELPGDPAAAYTIDHTGCEHLSRDVANIRRIAAVGAKGSLEVVLLYAAPPAPAVVVKAGGQKFQMGDIVKRLRAVDHMSVEDCFLQSPLFAQAADIIERLTAIIGQMARCKACGSCVPTTGNDAWSCDCTKMGDEFEARQELTVYDQEAWSQLSDAEKEIERLTAERDNARREHEDSPATSDTQPRYTTTRLRLEVEKAKAYARREALEEAAVLVESHIVMNTHAGKELRPRQDGNQDGLFYAAAIRTAARAMKGDGA